MSSESALWLNGQEIKSKFGNADLHCVLYGENGLFASFGINIESTRPVHVYTWNESHQRRAEHKLQYRLDTKFYRESEVYSYPLAECREDVHFKLQFHRTDNFKETVCSLCLLILSLPEGVEYVKTEMDVLCHVDGKRRRGLMRPLKLSPKIKSVTGINIFRAEDVAEIESASLEWRVALKMLPKFTKGGTAYHTQTPKTPDFATKMNKSSDIAQEPPEFTSYDNRDDKKWMNTVKYIDPKTDELRVYETLVASVGIYKWQGSTGSLNARHLSHVKPKWKNIKEFCSVATVLIVSICTSRQSILTSL